MNHERKREILPELAEIETHVGDGFEFPEGTTITAGRAEEFFATRYTVESASRRVVVFVSDVEIVRRRIAPETYIAITIATAIRRSMGKT